MQLEILETCNVNGKTPASAQAVRTERMRPGKLEDLFAKLDGPMMTGENSEESLGQAPKSNGCLYL